MRTESSLESLADFFTNCLLRHLILNPLSLRPRHSSRPQSWCVVETFHAEFTNRKVEKFGQWWREGKISFSVLGAKFAFTSLVWMRIQFEDFLPLSLLPFPFSKKRVHICRGANKCAMLGKILDGAEGGGGRQSRGGEARCVKVGRRPTVRRVGGKSGFHVFTC